ncbi:MULTISPECIES: (d)CMP kinase [unclassified Schaalia]|uniref:(d)CMP kinase n=1 Tax=unclassified Schaalia TaxID=2691889 RepID=UPI001E3B046D|nr:MULTISPECIES: (d)CMP kinase [unclassified Schaalia]MCD4549374.1 (d)CMP kinase [Schaalia sp. lx-260]MCD4557182.1 (d)CMP kinase [Schaalia sp. lx-100]
MEKVAEGNELYEECRRLVKKVGVTIAIDGPAGSGKSTVSRRIADILGIGYLDTGAMYRALTWYALETGVELTNQAALRALADDMPLHMDSHPLDPHFFVGEVEVTQAIREPRIALGIPHVSTNKEVRAWMAREQRERMMQARSLGSGMVAEGRDITTVVCPDADVRVLLLADSQARLRRRTLELYGDDAPEHMDVVRAQIENRDKADSTVSEFMEAAPGVHTLDSTGLSIDAVVNEICLLVKENTEHRSLLHES